MNPTGSYDYYSYVITGPLKESKENGQIPYGKKCTAGDVITTRLVFEKGRGRLSF